MQAENREGEAGEKVQKKAELLSQAQLIRASMAESQLHNFRTESKNRCPTARLCGDPTGLHSPPYFDPCSEVHAHFLVRKPQLHMRLACSGSVACSCNIPQAVTMIPCACRTAVLRKLGHINEDGVVTLKGRAACELDTADELLSSELLLNGVFSALDIHQLPALASTLIPQEKSTVGPFSHLSMWLSPAW